MKKWFVFTLLKLSEIGLVYLLFWKFPMWIGHLEEKLYASAYPSLYAVEGYPVYDQFIFGIGTILMVLTGAGTILFLFIAIKGMIRVNLKWAEELTKKKKMNMGEE